ncbi:hypothetical protein EBF04_22835 [Streptomyces sp. I6]|nr:hypothetical protein EBF04_22835 [Streptomyces sp. I6]
MSALAGPASHRVWTAAGERAHGVRQAGSGAFLAGTLEAVLPSDVAAPALSGATRGAVPDRDEGRPREPAVSHRPSSTADL